MDRLIQSKPVGKFAIQKQSVGIELIIGRHEIPLNIESLIGPFHI